MITRTLCATGLALLLAGSASLDAGTVSRSTRGGDGPRTPQPTSASQSGDGVTIPGGIRFVASAAGMRRLGGADDTGETFLHELTGYLSADMVLDYSVRVRQMVATLRDLEDFLAEIDQRQPGIVPSLTERGTPAYEKAVDLLDFLGFRVVDDTDRIQLQRRVGDREARLRQLLGFLGVSVPLQSRLWAAGEAIVINIQNTNVPIPFGRAAWSSQVFDEDIDADGLFDRLMEDAAARHVLAGFAALDQPTRDVLYADVGLASLHRDDRVASGFWQIAPYLLAVDGELRLPGGDRAAWQAILGEWDDTADLIARVVTKDNGRPAHLWRALSLVPEARASYLLTLNRTEATERGEWARELYDTIRLPDFGTQPIRWPEDTAEFFTHLTLRADGQGIDWPGGATVWLAAVADDDPLAADGALDTLLGRFADAEEWGPTADAALLRAIIEDSEPDRDGPTAIRRYMAVKSAIRYQPTSATRRAIPLLYRNYRRFGRAYGFFVMPSPLPGGTAELLVRHLQKVDTIERDEARIDAIRQLQASLMLLHEVLLNDLLIDEDREAVLQSFLELPITGAAAVQARGATSSSQGYGPAVTEWWRGELIPALARGLKANGWPGDSEDLRAVVVTSLVGRIGVTELEVDGIDYNFMPAATQGRRMYVHLQLQQQPSFEDLFRLDEIAAVLAAGSGTAANADEIDNIVDSLRAQMPPNIGDEEVSEALPVTVARNQLFETSATLTAQLRAAGTTDSAVETFRDAVNVYLGDALVGITYALHMGDPGSFTYQQGHIAWLHRLIIAELGGDGPEDLFSPWAPTAESWILDEGSRMHNSLFGAPDTLSRWNVEDMVASGGLRDPAAGEAWAAALAHIHLPSLTPAAQRLVSQRHSLGTSWIREAVRARNPETTPSFWVGADPSAAPPTLTSSLRSLMRPSDIQLVIDAITDGRESDALNLVTDGNLYLLALGLDNYDIDAPPAARWLIDQMVGMPVSRRGDYLGLETPQPIPYGEAGDQMSDAPLYTRLFDIRVRLAVVMEAQGLPAGLHARLLMSAMARILSTMTPATWQPWHNVLEAIEDEISDATVRQWVVDLAFADELTPSDPTLALEDLSTSGDMAGVPVGRTGALGVPVDRQQYEAAFGAEVNMVTVDISAWNDNVFVTDLTLEDIVLTRDGVPVTPAFMRLEGSPEPSVFLDDLPPGIAEKVTPAPRNFVMVADLLTTSPQDWERILLDVTEFVRAGIGVEDRLALVTIDSRGAPRVTQDFTIDHERVAEILEAQVGNSFATYEREQSFIDLSIILCDNGLCGSGAGCEPLLAPRFYQCITEDENWESQKFRLAQAQLGRWSIEANLKAEQVMSALTQVASMLDLGDPYDRQKEVILLSSGFERQPGSIHHTTLVEYASYSPTLDPAAVRTIRDDLSLKLDEVIRILQRCRCTVYSLATLGQAAFIGASAQLPNSLPVVSRFTARNTLQGPLNALARETGGTPFFGTDMSLGFRDVLEDTRLRYVLGFVMQDTPPDAEPTWHEIKVDIRRDDVDKVRSREGFFWPRR